MESLVDSSLVLLAQPRRWCFHLYLLVWQQDNTKTTEELSTALGWRKGLSPEQTPLTFGVDPG